MGILLTKRDVWITNGILGLLFAFEIIIHDIIKKINYKMKEIVDIMKCIMYIDIVNDTRVELQKNRRYI